MTTKINGWLVKNAKLFSQDNPKKLHPLAYLELLEP
jgi:hypothetical protein